MFKLFFGFLVIAINVLTIASADEQADIKKIQNRLTIIAPGTVADSITPSAVPGIYEVAVGADVFYMTGDGRYAFSGELHDMETNTNLSEQRKVGSRKAMLNKLDESQMVVFSPKSPRHTVTVFTDIDCAYCRKLHQEMAELNSYGIKVRYLMFPRSGVNTPSYNKAVSVWCADDKQIAMTKAKAGEEVPAKTCKNPIKDQFEFGRKMGVNGTPALFLEDGTIISGYRPAKELAQTLDSHAKKN